MEELLDVEDRNRQLQAQLDKAWSFHAEAEEALTAKITEVREPLLCLFSTNRVVN